MTASVQTLFIAEVIVHRGEVGPGPLADLTHRGVAETLLGKDLPGGLQQALLGFGADGNHLSWCTCNLSNQLF